MCLSAPTWGRRFRLPTVFKGPLPQPAKAGHSLRFLAVAVRRIGLS